LKLLRFVPITAALAVILASSALTWVTVNYVIIQSNESLLQLYNEVMRGTEPTIQSLNQSVDGGLHVAEISLILYPISVSVSLLAFRWKRMSVIAGPLAVITGLIWIYGIELLRNEILSRSSGIFGHFVGSLTEKGIGIGLGPYVMITGGLLIFVNLLTIQRKPTNS
jgi:hypothetical protein